MKRFIILTCLVAMQFAQEAHVKKMREVSGNTINFELKKLFGEIKRCVVTTNTGEEITLFPKDPSHDSQNDTVINYTFFNVCQPRIQKATLDMSGKWTIKRTFTVKKNQSENTISEEFHIQVKDILERKDMSPSSSIRIQEGNYAIFKIAERFENLQSCILADSKKEYDLSLEKYAYLKIPEPSVCGVRMLIGKNQSETWNLYAEVGTNETYYGIFTIDILNAQDYGTLPKALYMELGKEGKIIFGQNSLFTYCQLEDPNGKKLPVQAGECKYEIPTVTKLHEGIWKAHYGTIGSITPMKANLSIVTFDSPPLNVTVTHTQGKHINLLCRVRGSEIEYCRFTRPDNMTFSVTPGVGNDRYDYYGAGFRKERFLSIDVHDCGLTIKSPLKEDFGAWKCTMHVSGKTTGAILRTDHLSKMFNTQDIKTYGGKVYVQRGNSFTVKCSAEAALNYCWLLSPNGTVYSVSGKGSSPSYLTYKGSGLGLGECGAVVTVADDTHLGEWSCRMGVINGMEVEASVSVAVTDSLLIADKNTIDIYHTKSTVLTCRILPGDESAISYCRWIRPDGHGIYKNVDNQYVTEETLSSCKLTIQELNVNYDVGSWSCIAGIPGYQTTEAFTQIIVTYSYMELGGFISIALTIALLVITTVTLFVIIRHRRRIIYPDEKAILVK